MTALVFGTAPRSDWTTLGIQMVYPDIYSMLLMFRVYDRFSIDELLARRKTTPAEGD